MGMFSNDKKEDIMIKQGNNAIEDYLRSRIIELETKNSNLLNTVKILEESNKAIKERAASLEKLKECMSKIFDMQRTLASTDEDKITLDDFLNRQQRIFQNKVNHGFNVTNIYQEARYILEEVTELMRAIEKNDRENMIEELADIIIFTYGCAEVARLGSLDAKIFEKMALNEKRVYKQTDEGDFVKTGLKED